MVVRVEINYNRRKNEVEVYIDESLVDLPYLQGKLVQEWFNEARIGNGDKVWLGLLQELKEVADSNDISLEFMSDDSKSIMKFYDCLNEQGVDVDKDSEEEAIILNFDKIAHNNYLTALTYLDVCEELARKYFLKSAVDGHVNAQYELGKCYYYSIGGDFDEESAIYWLKEAINQGSIDAQDELSVIQEEDEDTRNYNREMMMLTEQFNTLNGLDTALLELDD